MEGQSLLALSLKYVGDELQQRQQQLATTDRQYHLQRPLSERSHAS
jgi:hypothetical protein